MKTGIRESAPENGSIVRENTPESESSEGEVEIRGEQENVNRIEE